MPIEHEPSNIIKGNEDDKESKPKAIITYKSFGY